MTLFMCYRRGEYFVFCENCGAELKKEGKFCENCGAEAIKKKKKPKTKKRKMIERIIIGVFIILGFIYAWFNHQLSPETIAKNYFLAVVNQDVDKLYTYIGNSDSEFITKDILKEIIANKGSDGEFDIKNYTIGDAKIDYDGLHATVKINYIEKNNKDYTFRVEFVKNKGKKYLFFDDWRIVPNGKFLADIRSGFEMKVPKGSTVTIRGIEVDKKYINTTRSDDIYDVYKLPAMFESKYKIKVALPFGFEVESELDVSALNYEFKLKSEEIPENVREELKETARNALQVLYDGAIAQKPFEEIQSAFDYEGVSLNSLKLRYDSLKSKLSESNLNTIQFKEINFEDIKNGPGEIEISMKVECVYTLGENEGSRTMSIKVRYTNKDQSLKIVDVSGFESYSSVL